MPPSDSVPAEPSRHVGTGAILPDSDVPCVHCGYNLRGLRPEGHCPECGVWIAVSVGAEVTRRSVGRERTPQYLEAASPVWLLTLQRGCGLCLAGAGSLLLLGLPAGALLWIHRHYWLEVPAYNFAIEMAGTWLLRGALFLWVCLFGLGVWLLTTPSANEAKQPDGARLLARWCTFLALGGCIGIVLAKPVSLPGGIPTALFLMLLPCGPFGIIAWCALAVHMSRLACRARDARLAWLAKSLAWYYGVGWLLSTCVSGFLLPETKTAAELLMTSLIVAVALIMLMLPYRLRQHLRTALERVTRAHMEQGEIH